MDMEFKYTKMEKDMKGNGETIKDVEMERYGC